MAGLLQKQSKHAEDFKDMQVLHKSATKLSYLVTPEGNDYLKKVFQKEITLDHQCA